MDHQDFAQLLGNYGEFIGAIAVVVTLGYLAFQIRQNTAVARSSIRHNIAEMTVGQVHDLVVYRDVAEMFMKSALGESIDPVDELRLQARCYIEFRRFENFHYQYSSGLLTEQEWRGFRRNLKAALGIEHYRRSWEAEGAWYSESFRSEIGDILAELDSDPSEGDKLRDRIGRMRAD